MRHSRLKIPASEADAVYHCYSRTVNGEFLFRDGDKEIIRQIIWQVVKGCGAKLLSYAILDNHFHSLILIPQATPLPDEELLRRHAILYPRLTRPEARKMDRVREQLASNGPLAIAWRSRMLALMSDVSQLLKLIKQRVTKSYNRRHKRFGTLWAERFGSGVVEPKQRTSLIVAGYIDLNPFRAYLAIDPKDFRFSGYGEAVAGSKDARSGIMWLMGSDDWETAQASYRQMIYGIGSAPRGVARTISHADFVRVMKEGGRLEPRDLLRCRLPYFTRGRIFGSVEFIEQHRERYEKSSRCARRARAHRLPDFTGFGDLATAQRIRLPIPNDSA